MISFSQNLKSEEKDAFYDLILQNSKLYYQTSSKLILILLLDIIPLGIEIKNIKNDYLKLRSSFLSSSLFRSREPANETLLELFAFSFKINENFNYLSDLLSNWTNFVGEELALSKTYLKLTSELVLNSEMENKSFYHKQIDKIYEKDKRLPDYFVQKAISFFKDGNTDLAIKVRL